MPQARHLPQRHRPALIHGMRLRQLRSRGAGPDQAHPQAIAQHRIPPRHRCRIGPQIRDLIGNRGDDGATQIRQAHQRRLHIKIRKRITPRKHRHIQALQQPHQRRLHHQTHLPLRRQTPCVAAELQRVAKPSLGMQQHMTPGQWRPVPTRLGKGLHHAHTSGDTGFISGKPRRQIAPRQQTQGEIPARRRVMRINGQSPLIIGAGRLQPHRRLQRHATVIAQGGMIGRPRDRRVKHRQRLRLEAQGLQRIAPIHQRRYGIGQIQRRTRISLRRRCKAPKPVQGQAAMIKTHPILRRLRQHQVELRQRVQQRALAEPLQPALVMRLGHDIRLLVWAGVMSWLSQPPPPPTGRAGPIWRHRNPSACRRHRQYRYGRR